MAAKYRKIDPRIWTDDGFGELIPRQKLMALYAITAQSNRCGIFNFSIGAAIEQTGFAEDEKKKPDSYAIGFAKVCQTLKWKYDVKLRVLYIPTWWKYNPPENPKHLRGCMEDLHELPNTPLLREFLANEKHIPSHCLSTFNEIAMRIAMPYQEQEQEQNIHSPNGEWTAAAVTASPEAKCVAAKPTKRPRKQPSGSHQQLVETFCGGWKERYGVAYPFKGGRDGEHIAFILRAVQGDFAAAERAVKAFLADEEEFVVRRRHPLGQMVNDVQKYLVPADYAPGDAQLDRVLAHVTGNGGSDAT